MKTFFDKIAANGPLYTAGQIIGLALIIWNFFIYVQKSHEKILIFKCAGDLMSVVQFAFCGAYTGAALNVVMAFREIIFLNKTKHKWASGKIWLYIFIALIFLSPFVTSKEPILSALWLLNVLPAFGSSLAVVGLYNENTLITKTLSGKSILSSLYHEKSEEIAKGRDRANRFDSGLMSDTPEYLERYEAEGIKKLCR